MQNYNIIGVDIAVRNSGISLYNTETKKFPFFGVLKYAPKFEYEYNSLMGFKHILYNYLESSVMPYASPSLPFVFVVEGITRKGHFHTTIKIMLTRSMMFNYIHDKEHSSSGFNLLEVYTPEVQKWKKELIGKGNASKEDTYSWLMKERTNYNVPLPVYEDDDMIDATCLAIYGLAQLRKSEK